MKIHCFATVSLEQDAPIPAILQFVTLLRGSAVSTGLARIDINLVGISARARATIQKFQPERANGVAFPRALEIAEELTSLKPAEIKSLNFMLSAEGFRWKGSTDGTSASLALLDGKTFQRKQRFHISAHLFLEAADPKEAFIDKMLSGITVATGIRFEKEISVIHLQPSEPGRATPQDLLITALAWRELIKDVGEKARETISIERVPHLMTTYQAHDFLFNPAKSGKSVPVNFSRIVRKWLKEEFPDYKRDPEERDGEYLQKEISEGIVATLRVDKRAKAFSKEFTIGLGVGLTSPRFAPTPSRPFHLPVNLFHLFGIWPLPMQWTYYSEADLDEALKAAAPLLRQVLKIFEPRAVNVREAYKRGLEEFEGPREFSAKEAHDLALPLAKAWAEDSALTKVNSNNILGPYPSSLHVDLPSLDSQGRLATNGGWHFTFYSRSKRETLHVIVPYRGSVTLARMDAPDGRQWPSNTDQILRDGWVDSVEALWLAKAKVQDIGVAGASTETQLFELASRANVLASGIIQPPFRDGMFIMQSNWRISFSRKVDDGRSTATITVPAYGDGAPTAEVHTYDRRGRPTSL
ncbi:MAG TPA: hypothetical protein VGI46_03415 [Candidatus Acidoferrum sp.]|jgi:hypothetical protein